MKIIFRRIYKEYLNRKPIGYEFDINKGLWIYLQYNKQGNVERRIMSVFNGQ